MSYIGVFALLLMGFGILGFIGFKKLNVNHESKGFFNTSSPNTFSEKLPNNDSDKIDSNELDILLRITKLEFDKINSKLNDMHNEILKLKKSKN